MNYLTSKTHYIKRITAVRKSILNGEISKTAGLAIIRNYETAIKKIK